MDNQTKPLAIASVEKQQCDKNNLYDPKTALFEGTIFPELNLPFFATESIHSDNTFKSENEEEELLNKISMESFYLDDLTLYMDTHDCDKEIIAIFDEHLQKREELTKEFAEKYYPLTRHFIPYSKQHPDCFSWKLGKPVWEGGCC